VHAAARERVLNVPEHEGQRRAELVADVGEEDGLGAVELGQCFCAFALLLVGPRIGDGARDLRFHQLQEVVVAIIELEVRTDAGHEESRYVLRTDRRDRQDHRGVRRIGEGTGRPRSEA
jgi:hypothetical protein